MRSCLQGLGFAMAALLPFAANAACLDTAGIEPPHAMAFVEGGTFAMGDNDERPEERAVREVTVGPFWIDRLEVTNREFAAFVEATGYVTTAEKGLDPARYPNLPAELTQPGGLVFEEPESADLRGSITQWWRYQPGADWRHPAGPDSSIEGKEDHPVVQISYEDALAFARWKGRDLPTEAEWEYAARGGLEGARFTWGESYDPIAGWKANSWQGAFPVDDDAADGHHGTAPVGCYEANGYGLHDMAGNVWEYARDLWAPGHPPGAASDPVGPDLATAMRFGGGVPSVVIKGGSWLCAPNFCLRYRPAARQPQELSLGTNHIGFRTVLRGTSPPG